MIGRALFCAAALSALASAGRAQTGLSTAGDVGSAALRGGYPSVGGAATLPTLTNAPSTTTNAATNTAGMAATTTTTGGSSTGAASGGGGRGGTSSATGAGATSTSGSVRGGGSDWVLCEPTGASGLAPLFTGTDLSCAPH